MKAQQIRFKTKNQIFNEFIKIVQNALSSFNITDWEIRQLKQVFKINQLKQIIFISVITENQNGRQYYKKVKSENGIILQGNSKQEVKLRFSATRRELEKDTIETYNGADVLKVLRAYLQSPEGITELSKLGYAQYRAENISEMDFTNDSDNFQFLPYFDCTFLYTDSWNVHISEITKVRDKGIYQI